MTKVDNTVIKWVTDRLRAATGSYLEETKGWQRWLPLINGWLCAFACSIGSVYAIITAFDIPVRHFSFVVGCAFVAAVMALAACLERWGVAMSAILGAGGFFMLMLLRDMKAEYVLVAECVNEKLQEYVDFYFAVPEWEGAEIALLLPLAAALAVSAAAVAAVQRGFSATPLLVIVGAMQVSCLVLLGEPPAAWCEVLLAGIAIVLLLTLSDDHIETAVHALRVLPLVAALTLAVNLAAPPAQYERSELSDKMASGVEDGLSRAARLVGMSSQLSSALGISLPYTPWQPESDSIDLNDAGPQENNGNYIMDVYCSESKRMYLRAFSFAEYADNEWTRLEDEDYRRLETLGEPYLNEKRVNKSERQLLCVKSQEPLESILTTYHLQEYPAESSPAFDYGIYNTENLRMYNIAYDNSGWGTKVWDDPLYESFVKEHYTQVPPRLEKVLNKIAEEIGLDNIPMAQLPAAIAEYVRITATYDLNTPEVLAGEELVEWFLTKSKRGYCVHFATSGAMLLRTMGIPARLVTGYMVDTLPEEWVQVTDDSRHAWVEYYVSGAGWLPLECTGGSRGSTFSESTATTASTTVTTETTATTSTTAPPETEPTDDAQSVSSSEVATTGGAQPPQDDRKQPEAEKSRGSAAWWLLLPLPVAVGAVAARRYLLLLRRRQQYAEGDNNSRAIAVWKHIVAMLRVAKKKPPRELRQLAQKAQFSRHTLTAEELQSLLQYDARQTEELRGKDDLIAMLRNRFIRCLY